MISHWLQADWPAPPGVRTCLTTRTGGVSTGVWQGLNLGDHVGDDIAHVARNRALLAAELGCTAAWVQQVHGTAVVPATAQQVLTADALWTDTPGLACCIMTADCLPVLFCHRDGTRVAAAHAGWRGLLAGVLEQTLLALDCPSDEVMAWFGPAIGPQAFEVGEEVRSAFADQHPEAEQAFVQNRPGHYLADLFSLARQRLERCGVGYIGGGGLCTYSDPERFYSYRRDGQTGRMASLIWLDPH